MGLSLGHGRFSRPERVSARAHSSFRSHNCEPGVLVGLVSNSMQILSDRLLNQKPKKCPRETHKVSQEFHFVYAISHILVNEGIKQQFIALVRFGLAPGLNPSDQRSMPVLSHYPRLLHLVRSVGSRSDIVLKAAQSTTLYTIG
jgi:hypothetical protein